MSSRKRESWSGRKKSGDGFFFDVPEEGQRIHDAHDERGVELPQNVRVEHQNLDGTDSRAVGGAGERLVRRDGETCKGHAIVDAVAQGVDELVHVGLRTISINNRVTDGHGWSVRQSKDQGCSCES
jgi:hypothetical protein